MACLTEKKEKGNIRGRKRNNVGLFNRMKNTSFELVTYLCPFVLVVPKRGGCDMG